MQTLHYVLFGVLGSATIISGQDIVSADELRQFSEGKLPSLDSVRQREKPIVDVTEKAKKKPDFLRKFTIQSFGYSLALTGTGYENPIRLSAGPATDHGLECSRCFIRPSMERMRYTLPAFGTNATLHLANGRVNLFSGMGGTNAWKPDNSIIDIDGKGSRRTSFNDAWLLQAEVGANVALDKGRHVWLGAAGRYLENYGAGRKHWNTLSGSATFLFGH